MIMQIRILKIFRTEELDNGISFKQYLNCYLENTRTCDQFSRIMSFSQNYWFFYKELHPKTIRILQIYINLSSEDVQ